jgi:uncharacterized protein GlcG (DUF336 family)
MPVLRDGEVIGGVGVSGASTADEDQELATLAAAALSASCNGREGAAVKVAG